MKTKEDLKLYFEKGDQPTQEQFWEWMDSYWHKEEKIPANKIDIDLSQKADLINGKIPSSQLPDYVNDVITFNFFSELPQYGESGKIYLTKNNNNLYRWSNNQYIRISQAEETFQTITEKGKETTENIKVQGIYFGGNGRTENIVIGDESKDLNLNATNTIAIGNYTFPLGTDNIGIGKGVMNNSDSSGLGNIGLGHYVMQDALGANENTVIGFSSGNNVLYSQGNTILGAFAGTGMNNSVNFNNIIGYCAGRALGSGSNNNLILGNNSSFLGATFSNKLFIHSSNGSSSIGEGLISGDFYDRYININGRLSITPEKIPFADKNFTKNIVAKPDGTFGWENKASDDLRNLSYMSELTYTQDNINYYIKGTAYLCMKDGAGGNAGIGNYLKVFVDNAEIAGTSADRDNWYLNNFSYTTGEGTFKVSQLILPFTITIPKSTHPESYWTSGYFYATVVSTHNPFDYDKPTILQKSVKLTLK